MPRAGVSFEETASAIETLEKAGLNASVRNIREKLGKGSLTTLAEHKRRFEQERLQGLGPSLPDAISQNLIKGAETFWQELVDAAQAQIDAAKADYESQAQQAFDQREAAERHSHALQDRLDERHQACVDLQNENQTLTEALEQAQAHVAQQNVQLAALEAKLGAATARVADREQQLAELTQDKKHLQTEQEALRAQCSRLETQHAQAMTQHKWELKQAEQKTKEQEQQITERESARAQLEETSQHQKTQLSEFKQQSAVWTRERKDLQASLAKAKQQSTEQQSELQALQEGRVRLESSLKTESQQHQLALREKEKELTVLRETFERSLATLSVAIAEKPALPDTKSW